MNDPASPAPGTPAGSGDMPPAGLLSVITPAFNEEDNLPVLYTVLEKVLDGLDMAWEWIVVDDHSTDNTFRVMRQIAAGDNRVKALRLSRNSGSHAAFSCGLDYAEGDCGVVIAADMQDPPETIPTLVAEWQRGAHVVWAARADRKGETKGRIAFARAYYWIMRNLAGLKGIPKSGADFFLMDRRVIEAFRQHHEGNVSALALIAWMGFSQSTIYYEKQARLHGVSGWTLGKKIKLVIDSITSFSSTPIRAMFYLGLVTSLGGFTYAAVVIVNRYVNNELPEGWTSLMVVLLVVSGIQMLMLSILGEYLWRTMEESRRRPRYLIEEAVQGTGSVTPRAGDAHPPLRGATGDLHGINGGAAGFSGKPLEPTAEE